MPNGELEVNKPHANKRFVDVRVRRKREQEKLSKILDGRPIPSDNPCYLIQHCERLPAREKFKFLKYHYIIARNIMRLRDQSVFPQNVLFIEWELVQLVGKDTYYEILYDEIEDEVERAWNSGYVAPLYNQLNGSHGEYTDEDDMSKNKKFQNYKIKQAVNDAQYVPKDILSVKPPVSWEMLCDMHTHSEMTQAAVFAGVQYIKFTNEKSSVKASNYLKKNKFSCRLMSRTLEMVKLLPMNDYLLTESEKIAVAAKEDKEVEVKKEPAEEIPAVEESKVDEKPEEMEKPETEEDILVKMREQKKRWREYDGVNELEDFYYIDYRVFHGAGWYEKYDSNKNLTKDYKKRLNRSSCSFQKYINDFHFAFDADKESDKNLDKVFLLYTQLFGSIWNAPKDLIDCWRNINSEMKKIEERRSKTSDHQGVSLHFKLSEPEEYYVFELPSLSLGYLKEKEVLVNGKLKRFYFAEHKGFNVRDLTYYRYDYVEFLKEYDINHKDERPDGNSHGDIKHENAEYFDVEIGLWKKAFIGWTLVKYTKRVSRELFKHLLAPSNFNIALSYDQNFEKMNRCCRTSASVNISKNNILDNESVNNNTLMISLYYLRYYYLANPRLIEALALN